ncbi:hypothetical protein [Dyella flagellata]|uniref:Vitamin K epoxide reductase family protein n=1 Tax=Dyella flagellata TaxID=1867833 RepID=A0ABQ5XF11_9GAMM|nr:hypothetical protein [Dyella flagellata]GLQ89567.1 hypothetical protein GCM10007898_31410 [Dyella flagellata]
MTARRFFSIALPWFLLVAIGLLAAWLRYGFIQPPELAHLCDDAKGPAWCSARAAIVIGFNTYGYGIAAIIATAPALLCRKPWLACLAAALGLFALTLYCYIPGAIALLIGSLRLVRLQAREPLI